MTYYVPAELIAHLIEQLDINGGWLDAPTSAGKTLPAGELIDSLRSDVVVSNPPFLGGEPDPETCALN